MKTRNLIILCFALCISQKVYAKDKNDVKRGNFPYMAFIYYLDSEIVDETGARFLRGAVLIQPNWLVTSALGRSSVINVSTGFPRKTLLARLGAVTIDANFTLNEDEDEQEREIIEIVRPYNYSVAQWWRTDITLMKTLLPFNMTPAVGVTTLSFKHDYAGKLCNILVYVQKSGNWSGEKVLMQYSVAILPSAIENCGHHFDNQSMACADDIDDNAMSDPNFCQGNSGGPLVCEDEVMGLQTYIDNNCKQPHLYQLLSAWDNLINCSINDKCHEEQCENVCDITNKDAPVIEDDVKTMSNEDFITFASPKLIENITTSSSTSPNTEIDVTTKLFESTIVEESEMSTTDTANSTIEENLTVKTADTAIMKIRARPNKKLKTQLKKLDHEDLKDERKPKVEAQHHNVNKKIALYSYTPKIVCTFQTVVFGLFLVAYCV